MDLARFQAEFAAHLRAPRECHRPPGVAAARLRVYRELVGNNFESFLLACFPLTRQLVGGRRWQRLMAGFLAGHRCASPYFREIPREFLEWALSTRPPELAHREWLASLLHYEWLELAVDVMPDASLPSGVRADGDLMRSRPWMTPAHVLAEYDWPVHRAVPRRRLDRAPTRLLVFRDPLAQVRFIELNAVSARLAWLIAQGGRSGEAMLLQIGCELSHPDPQALRAHGLALLEDWRARGLIVGALAVPA